MSPDSRRLQLRAAVRREVPERPGVYTWLGRDGVPIYVGKSVNLRHRVLSYLAPGQLALESRNRNLAFAIDRFEWRETSGELLALLLEDALIKSLNPRFNERQRDYRERRYVLLTDDPFPACLAVEGECARGGTMFGPFKDEYFARDLIALVTGVFQLRACTDPIPFRKSARFDLGACPGPCRGAISAEGYAVITGRVREFFEGDDQWATSQLQAAMARAGDQLRFEEAAALRDSLAFCTRSCARQRFFRTFEAGLFEVVEERHGLRYRFDSGALMEVCGPEGATLAVPAELRPPVTDRRFLLDRANLVYSWLARGDDRERKPPTGV